MELTFEKLSSKVSTQLLKRQLTAHTTSQKSAHHAIHPIHSWWSWSMRSCSHYPHNFSKVIALHTQLLNSQLTTQFTLYNHIGADVWEVVLKSHLTAHTANWEQLLKSQLTTQFALQHENSSKVISLHTQQIENNFSTVSSLHNLPYNMRTSQKSTRHTIPWLLFVNRDTYVYLCIVRDTSSYKSLASVFMAMSYTMSMCHELYITVLFKQVMECIRQVLGFCL